MSFSAYTIIVHDSSGQRELEIELTPGTPVRIGRLPTNTIPVTWDKKVSREHAVLTLDGGVVKVECFERAQNPIVIGPNRLRAVNIYPGDEFQIGQTRFCLEQPEDDSAYRARETSAVDKYQFSDLELNEVKVSDSAKQMELLTELPELISSAASDTELAQLLAGLLLEAVPNAVAVAVAHYDEAAVSKLSGLDQSDTQAIIPPEMMRVRTRDDYEGRFMPSRRLVGASLKSLLPTIHVWGHRDESGKFTISEDLDWALCVPVPGQICSGWCFYVAGKGGKDSGLVITKDDLIGDVRFGQLLAQFIASVRQVKQLQETHTQLASFFSPKVVESITAGEDLLRASEQDVTVLFCDVRGFSRKAEQHSDDLPYLLTCVKEALGAMTTGILKYDGTIADFQGDAALGFWGWPVPLEDGAVPACLAALEIQELFSKPPGERGLLEGFSIGLGIAHGQAIAGQIGTSQQAKVGVFGPVVNQGARLESMTKQYGVQICIDEATADFVREHLVPERARVRRLARVRPKGMDTAITVSELCPPVAQSPNLPDEQISQYEAALDQVIAGDWEAARATLADCSDDGPKAFLLDWMARFENTPPADWDGAFSLADK